MDEDDIQFETDVVENRVRPEVSAPGLSGWLMRHSRGRITNEKQADTVLIAFACIIIALSLYLLVTSGGTKARYTAPPGERIIFSKDEPPRLAPPPIAPSYDDI